jgi:hypothetical protein
VVVRYTMNGSQETAQEIDRVGDGGLKTSEGVVARVIDRERKRRPAWRPTKARRSLSTYSDESRRKIAHYFKQVP